MATWQQLSLRHKILALTTGLVLASFLSGLLLMTLGLLDAIENELGLRAMSVGRTVAQVEAVQEGLTRPDGAQIIQPTAERMRLATGVEYIVVFDMNRTRLSHSLPDRIGTRFESGDEGPSLSQQAYVSKAVGVIGPSVRAFVPVLENSGRDQVGVVVVGILMPGMISLLREFWFLLAAALGGSILVGILGAWLLARSVKQQMFGLEPPEISRLLEDRVAMFSALGEGFLAIDVDGWITVLNEEAQRIIGVGPDAVGKSVTDLIPHSRLLETVKSGVAEHDQQMLLRRTIVVVNRVPVQVKDRIVGAVATFRDRTEVHRLAEELTGVTRFVEALRAQNHESLNKLHSIAGMVQLGRHEDALEYIFTVTEKQQEVSDMLARRIRDYTVSGLLLGKVLRGRELGILVTIDPESSLTEIPSPLGPSDLVLILGNLLENAMDALSAQDGERRIDCLLYCDSESLEIRVEDNGPGVPSALQARIYEHGVSTKGNDRGMGLALVQQVIHLAGGSIRLQSQPGTTIFAIALGGDEPGVDYRPNR